MAAETTTSHSAPEYSGPDEKHNVGPKDFPAGRTDSEEEAGEVTTQRPLLRSLQGRHMQMIAIG